MDFKKKSNWKYIYIYNHIWYLMELLVFNLGCWKITYLVGIYNTKIMELLGGTREPINEKV